MPALEFSDCLVRQFEEGKVLQDICYRGRYAPSPTGSLHLGNLRTALVSWLRARLRKGIWLLRIDDLDESRNRYGAIENLQKDLIWLGLSWDEPIVFQSRRKGLYYSVLSSLRRQGKLYACRCSRRIIAETARVVDQSLVYQGTCRDLALPWGWQENRLPSWRLKVNEEFDKICGDLVLRRSDGFVAYHLATVVDELTLGITEVVRGDDLRSAMPAQTAIFNSLGQKNVQYKYVPLMLDSEGRKLAKRDSSEGLDKLRAKGLDSKKVIGWLASSLKLAPEGSALTALELLRDLMTDPGRLDRVFSEI